MRVIYLNLDRSPDRRAWMEQQAASIGLTLERFPAIDASQLDNPPDFPVSLGAIGCFLSHRAIWDSIVKGDEPHVAILEDDVHLSPDLPSFLSDMSWIPEGADIVHLGGTQRYCLVERREIPVLGRRLFRVVGENTGCEAYIISKACAAQLHRDFVAIDQEFDQILFNGGLPHLSIYKMLPALGIQDHALDTPRFASLIERAVEKQKLTGVQKLRREAARIGRDAASFLGISPLRRMRVRFR